MADLSIATIGLAAQLFVSVQQTYHFISTAQSLTKESATIYWKLRIQQVRFESWGLFWGTERGALDAALEHAGLQDDVCGILREMEKLLLDTEKLSNKYRLEETKSDNANRLSSTVPDNCGSQPRRGPNLATKFKFAFKDNAKFEKLIEDLTSFNDGLFSLLRLAEYSAINVVMQSEMLRSAQLTVDLKDLQTVSAVEGNREVSQPPRNKQFYRELYLGASSKLQLTQRNLLVTDVSFPVGITPAPSSDMTSEQRLLGNLSEYLRDGPSTSRILVKFSSPLASGTASTPITVIVEWKYMDVDNPQFRLINARVNNLAKFLSASSPKPADFRALDCLGYVKDTEPQHPRFGYLFRLPGGVVSRLPISLFDALSRGSQGLLPDLGSRFELARKLAASIVRLHDCGWVHGGLNSTNIVFFWEKNLSSSRLSQTSTPTPELENRFNQLLKNSTSFVTAPDSISITSPYLMGFTYSRPTDPAESTLEWTANIVPTAENPHSLYRHPSIYFQGSKNADLESTTESGSLSHRQRHDLFSLGLILLEIGLWEQLSAIWKPKYSSNPVEFIRKLLRVYVPRLEHRMGNIYRDVVRCLLGGDEEWDGSSWERGILQEKYWAEIVSRLSLCHA